MHEETDADPALDEYCELLGISPPDHDAYEYMAEHGVASRDEAGIPTVIAREAYALASALAVRYEEVYDDMKARCKREGKEAQSIVSGDDGHPMAFSIPKFVATLATLNGWGTITDRSMHLTAVSLHALLVKHEWVFSHICEAIHMADRSAAARSLIQEDVVERLSEFKDAAFDAMRHYRHRST